MKKEFSSKEDFLDVISKIAKDGSVTISLNGDAPKIEKEKQYEYVDIAVNMDLKEAVDNMPTALRFDLIKIGYEGLLGDLKFEELDGPNDYWPGRMTSFILRKYPECEPQIDWHKLKNTWLVQVLIDQPQFENKIDFSKIDIRSSADLIAQKPQYANKFDLTSFNTNENSQYWFKILEKQPQFASICDWGLINDYQKNKLKQIHPNIEVSN